MPSIVDKYKPKSFLEFLGNKKQIEELREKIKNYSGRPIMIHGPGGVGKNLAIELIAKELGFEVIELTSSDLRNYDSIKETIFHSSRQQSLFRKGKIILVDELEITDSGTVRGIKEVASGSTFPVVLITSDPYEKNIYELRKISDMVKFDRIRYDVIAKFLRDIASKEKIEFDENGINQLARIADGDVRAALMDMESLGSVTEKNLKKLGERTYEQPVFETLKIMFKARGIENSRIALDHSDKTADEIFWWLEENIFREYSDPGEIASAYATLAKADYFQSLIIRRQSWGLQKYQMDMICSISMAKKEHGGKFVMYQPPRPFYRSSKTTDEQKDFIEKLSSSMHVSKRVAMTYMTMLKKNASKKTGLLEISSDEKEVIKSYA